MRLLLIALLAMPVFADSIPGDVVVYNNFGSDQGPFGIAEAVSLNQYLWAVQFTPTQTIRLAGARLPLYAMIDVPNLCDPNQPEPGSDCIQPPVIPPPTINLMLESNSADNLPSDEVLAVLNEESPLTADLTVHSFRCDICPDLNAAVPDWLVATESDPYTTAAWASGFNPPHSLYAANFPVNHGAYGWFPVGSNGTLAFEVDGEAPEPGTVWLLATGLLGMGGVALRRSRHRKSSRARQCRTGHK